jgi:hypothetical protein
MVKSLKYSPLCKREQEMKKRREGRRECGERGGEKEEKRRGVTKQIERHRLSLSGS